MKSIFKAMKKFISVLIGIVLLVNCQAGYSGPSGEEGQKSPAKKGSMTISTTPDLSDVAATWTGEFSAINPEVKINLKTLTVNGSGSLANTDLAFVSDETNHAVSGSSIWKMVIGRDAIVPIFNSSNPLLGEILRQGISADDLSKMFTDGGKPTWANLLSGAPDEAVNFYLIEDESIKSTVAGFVNLDALSINGIKVAGGPEMIAAVRKDPNSIGFCQMSAIIDPSSQNLVSQVSLLPIDKNGNGRMDYIEKIYGNVAELTRGIWIGKYPKILCRNLYACATVKPTGDQEIAFLKYVLTNGQQSLDLTGFNSLSPTERLSKIDRLPVTFLKAQTSDGINLTQLLLTIGAGIIFLLAMLTLVVRYRRNNRQVMKNIESLHVPSMNHNSLEVPGGLYFDKNHTWAFMDKDGSVKIGIDDFLQHVTGTITGIKMKNPGDKVRKGEPILTIIQKGKRLNVSAPVSGTITAENTILFTDPSFLNSSPYAAGWIYRIEPTNWLREIQFLFMADKYTEWLRTEFSRLKDFLAHAIKPNEPEYAYVVLQDGGEIADHILENLGPEVWEEFQTNFIDTSK